MNEKLFNENKEFAFTNNDLARVRSLIYKKAGISINSSKQDMVYSRVSRRVRHYKMQSFMEYLDWLEKSDDKNEWQEFVNCLTTNLTAFYRESHHFPVLSDYLKKSQGQVKIWCAASSTGEEPYSIAMTACEAYKKSTPPVKIIATDIDTSVITIAKQGVYPLDQVKKGIPLDQLQKYFMKGVGKQEGQALIKPDLRKLIEYKSLNLLDSTWNIEGPLDIIFCRNVMIYFDKITQGKILEKLTTMLKPGGLLFVGHSENFSNMSKSLKLLGKTVYFKTND